MSQKLCDTKLSRCTYNVLVTVETLAFKSNFFITSYLSRLNKADEFALGDVGCAPLAGEWGVNLRVAPPSLLADSFAAVMRLEVDGAFIPDKVLAPAVEGVGIAAVEIAFFMPVLLPAGLGKVANFLLTVDAMASSAVMVESKSSDSEG